MEEIFAEVEPGRRKAFEESWCAVNKWVLEKMRERCGVHLASLAKLKWQRVGPNRGRPIFLLTQAYRRAHGLSSEEEEEDEDDCCAEMDFSVIALRYSKTLTKDTAFSCYRELSRALGKRIATPQPLKIDMSVGTLTRDVHGVVSFEFDNVALRPKWSSCIEYADDAVGLAFQRCVGDVERIAEQSEYEEREARRIAANEEARQRQRIENQKNARRELQNFLLKQMIEQREARRRPKTPPLRPGCWGGVAARSDDDDARSTTGLSQKLRQRRQQLKEDLECQIESKASRERRARQEMLEEEMSFVRHVREEMERTRRDEMERTRSMNEDVARAWRASAHVKNLQKLATKGHATLREYVSSRSVGFDPRSTTQHSRCSPYSSSMARDIAKSCIDD